MRTLTRRDLLVGGLGVIVRPRPARAASSAVYLVRTGDRTEGIRRGLAALASRRSGTGGS